MAFLNNDGLSYFWNKLKGILDGKSNKSEVEEIQSLIPSSASSTNKLIDENYIDDNYVAKTDYATDENAGVIKVGNGLNIENGILSAIGGGGSNITYGAEDLIEDVSPLADGTIYFVYE